MWTYPECNTRVEDDQPRCVVCGAPPQLGERHDQTLFSSFPEAKDVTAKGFRYDLACVVVRAFGLYLLVDASMQLPNVFAGIVSAAQFTNKMDLHADAGGVTGTFTAILIALAVTTISKLACGAFLLMSDVVIRILARPIR